MKAINPCTRQSHCIVCARLHRSQPVSHFVQPETLCRLWLRALSVRYSHGTVRDDDQYKPIIPLTALYQQQPGMIVSPLLYPTRNVHLHPHAAFLPRVSRVVTCPSTCSRPLCHRRRFFSTTQCSASSSNQRADEQPPSAGETPPRPLTAGDPQFGMC